MKYEIVCDSGIVNGGFMHGLKTSGRSLASLFKPKKARYFKVLTTLYAAIQVSEEKFD
jgi:hypothetical protein